MVSGEQGVCSADFFQNLYCSLYAQRYYHLANNIILKVVSLHLAIIAANYSCIMLMNILKF